MNRTVDAQPASVMAQEFLEARHSFLCCVPVLTVFVATLLDSVLRSHGGVGQTCWRLACSYLSHWLVPWPMSVASTLGY